MAAQLEAAAAPTALAELVGDRGYHSNQVQIDVDTLGPQLYRRTPPRPRS
jgi:hypothetical protein